MLAVLSCAIVAYFWFILRTVSCDSSSEHIKDMDSYFYTI